MKIRGEFIRQRESSGTWGEKDEITCSYHSMMVHQMQGMLLHILFFNSHNNPMNGALCLNTQRS